MQTSIATSIFILPDTKGKILDVNKTGLNTILENAETLQHFSNLLMFKNMLQCCNLK